MGVCWTISNLWIYCDYVYQTLSLHPHIIWINNMGKLLSLPPPLHLFVAYFTPSPHLRRYFVWLSTIVPECDFGRWLGGKGYPWEQCSESTPWKFLSKNFLDPEKFCANFFLKRFCRFYGIFPEIFMVEKFSVKVFVDFHQKKACTDIQDLIGFN